MSDPKSIAEWLVNTCLLFGSTVGTAYKVAGLFIEGIEIEPPPRQVTAKPDGRRNRGNETR